MSASPHFELVRAGAPGPVFVEIPHAGLVVDDLARKHTKIPRAALAAGALLADSDVGADLVWDGVACRDVSRIVARTSRYVVDLNTTPRVPAADEEKLPAALRAVLHRSRSGLTWRQTPPPAAELIRRLREIFEPYHAAIALELEALRARWGAALLLASHTFPDGEAPGVDVVLGTLRGASARAELRDAIAEAARSHGLRVALETPFAGGYSVSRHAHLEARVSVVQLEIARGVLCTDPAAPCAVVPAARRRVEAMLVDLVAAARAVLTQEAERASSRRET